MGPVPGGLRAPLLPLREEAVPAKGETSSSCSGLMLPSERELLYRLRSGDEAAFRSLVAGLHGRLLRLALGFLPRREIAEEVVQETWLAVVEGLSSFEGRSSLQTWIFRVLVNRAKTRAVREARVRSFSDLSLDEGEEDPGSHPACFHPDGRWALPPRDWGSQTPESVAIQREALAQFEKAVAELPLRQRLVVLLRDVEGLDSLEVCNMLGIRETHQRVLLHRARTKLRKALEEYVERS